MTIADLLLPEFQQEMAGTRRVLERTPEDKFDWRLHPKSNTIGWVANHLSEIPSWTAGTLTQDSWDINPPGGPPYKSPAFTSVQKVLEYFDQNVAEGVKALESASDADFAKPWSLLNGGKVFFTLPRLAVIRTWVINHTIHHRAHLCVYLRVNDVNVPSLYGPSGDEG